MKKIILALSILGLCQPICSFFSSTSKKALFRSVSGLGLYLWLNKKIKNTASTLTAKTDTLTAKTDTLEAEIDPIKSKYAQCPLVKKQDTKFYDFCEEIKRRSKIQEPVIFKFFGTTDFPEKMDVAAFYHHWDQSIYINEKLYTENISHTEFVVAHECEHFRQDNEHSGSYHGDDCKLKETGADAAAAGLIECYLCLEQIVQLAPVAPSEKGYFCQKDYLPYQERLAKDRKFCKGCVKRYFNRQPDWKDYLSLWN